jgi:hypothetical protein
MKGISMSGGLLVALIILLTAPEARAGALYKMDVKFASMTENEIVVRGRQGKRVWLRRSLIKKSDQALLEKKSNGSFVKIAVISSAVIKKE